MMTQTPDVQAEVARLGAQMEALACEARRLADELANIRELLYGDGNPGLRTTVTLIQEWICEEKLRREEERRRAWQLKLAIWGWVVAAALSVSSRFL